MDLELLTDKLIGRLFVEMEVSGRHVHITREQAQTLFGHDLTPSRELSQPGQFLAAERLTVKGPKGEFHNVAVLGPARKEAQVEISLSDGRVLGITPPIRPSGNVEASPGAVLIGPQGQVALERGVIVAQRHIHVHPEDARSLGVQDGKLVRLQTFTHRPVVFGEVLVRVDPAFQTRVHLDCDEANACGYRSGDLGRILS